MKNSTLVNAVLETSGGNASDMTHALGSLGGGNMGKGLLEFWHSGQRIGMMKGATVTAAVFSIGIGVGLLVLDRHHQKELEAVENSTIDAYIDIMNSLHEKKCKKCMAQQQNDSDFGHDVEM